MSKPVFRLEASFDDNTGEAVAVYLRVREGTVARTVELKEGIVYADYGADDTFLGLELLGPCELELLEHVAKSEPEAVRRFLRGGAPRELVPGIDCG